MQLSKALLITFFIATAITASAQYIPLERNYYHTLEQYYQRQGKSHISTLKPLLLQENDSISQLENELYKHQVTLGRKPNFLNRKLFNEHFIDYQHTPFRFTADPIFNFAAGYDPVAGSTAWTNTRGMTLTGLLGNNFAFNTELYENQSVFPEWPAEFIRQNGVVPGQGWAKAYGSKGFDYFYSNGYMSYSPVRFINITLGYGKHFIGQGYRSLLLSDASFSYPYLRVSGNFRKIKYTALYTQFIDRSKISSPAFGYDRKWAAMHFFETLLWGKLSLGFFDAIIWENADSTGIRGFDVQYLNPIMLLRPVEESFGSPDNALMGGTAGLQIGKHLNLYGQLVLDEFKLSHVTAGDGWWANKFGYQLGVSVIDVANIRNLNLQVEYNQVRPYTYAHSSTVESYGHYNQPLAHPLGANFRETVAIGSYSYLDWTGTFKINLATYGADTNGLDFGKNIFTPYDQRIAEFGNEIGQGNKTHLSIIDLNLAYTLNKNTNMRLEAGVNIRNQEDMFTQRKMAFFYLAFRTGLRNLYYDF